MQVLLDGCSKRIDLARTRPFDFDWRLRREPDRMFLHTSRGFGDFDRLGSRALHRFTAKIVAGGEAPRIVDQDANTNSERLTTRSVADLAVLRCQRALAIIHYAGIGIACAALRSAIESPVGDVFHGHGPVLSNHKPWLEIG